MAPIVKRSVPRDATVKTVGSSARATPMKRAVNLRESVKVSLARQLLSQSIILINCLIVFLTPSPIECPLGYFGSGCLRRCHCRDDSEVCDYRSGACTQCAEGFGGNDCYTSKYEFIAISNRKFRFKTKKTKTN